MARAGILFVVAAPSGGGKRTVLDRVMADDGNLAFSVSATTRDPRPDEQHGREYWFMQRAAFEAEIRAGGFAEWAEVHGNLYGTPRRELDRIFASGMDAVLEVDVQGMRNLKQSNVPIVSVFITAPSFDELERRLRHRGTETEEQISVRLANARTEYEARGEFDYIIVNDALDGAVDDMRAIVRAERLRSHRHGGWQTGSGVQALKG
ncbi:MAG: hypothetical protein AMXMBFR84_25740 [Candidatus Hydrogenedentota bacterium]